MNARPTRTPHRRRSVVALLSGAACLLALAGCPKPPTDLLKKLKETLDGMALAKKCAPESYRAAQKMYEEAIELEKKKAYKEATQAAEAAQKLADKARADAEANKAKCEAIAAADKNSGALGTGTPDGGAASSTGAGTDPGAGKGTDLSQTGVAPDTPVLERVVVYFGFNKFDLSPESTAKLSSFVAANKDKGGNVEIEGHCDVRGSVEYNLSLGEKRARAVRDFFVSQGMPEKSIVVISYGSEKPEVDGSSEDAHAKNRRAVINRR